MEVVPPPDPRPRQGQERATSAAKPPPKRERERATSAAKPPPKREAGEGDRGSVASKEFEAGQDGFVFVDDVFIVEVSIIHKPSVKRPWVGGVVTDGGGDRVHRRGEKKDG